MKMPDLHLGDCREILPTIPDRSVHICITDPPYGLDGMDENWDEQKLRQRITSASARTSCMGGMPSSMRFCRNQGRKLYEFLLPICTELHRILMPGSIIIMFSQGRLYHRIADAIEDSDFEIRDMYAWSRYVRPKAMAVDGHWKTPMLASEIEPMVMATVPRDGTYKNNWEMWQVGLLNTLERPNGRFPSSLMPYPKDARSHDHITPKPVNLIEHLIRLFSNPGQIIIDPFMGSGSHGEAALRCGLDFIGIERDRGHFERSSTRLENIR